MQGGTRTPKEFNNCINYTLKPVITKWHDMDMGFKLEDRQINHIIWADNIFILARTPLEMQLMMDDVTEALNRVGLRWKPGSPVLIATKNYNGYNTQIYNFLSVCPPGWSRHRG